MKRKGIVDSNLAELKLSVLIVSPNLAYLAYQEVGYCIAQSSSCLKRLWLTSALVLLINKEMKGGNVHYNKSNREMAHLYQTTD